jgi:GNAT superfamily N-acetyltransferase
MTVTIHHGVLPGAIGRIAELHAIYYSALAGFGVFFEAKVARELADFCERYVETRDGLWLAILNDRIEGAIAIDGSHAASDGAHLRWFITSEQIRGAGIGSNLLSSALAFAQAQRYPRVFLWTFEGLDAARHLYEKVGFRLIYQQPGSQWGAKVNEQCFELRT